MSTVEFCACVREDVPGGQVIQVGKPTSYGPLCLDCKKPINIAALVNGGKNIAALIPHEDGLFLKLILDIIRGVKPGRDALKAAILIMKDILSAAEAPEKEEHSEEEFEIDSEKFLKRCRENGGTKMPDSREA